MNKKYRTESSSAVKKRNLVMCNMDRPLGILVSDIGRKKFYEDVPLPLWHLGDRANELKTQRETNNRKKKNTQTVKHKEQTGDDQRGGGGRGKG